MPVAALCWVDGVGVGVGVGIKGTEFSKQLRCQRPVMVENQQVSLRGRETSVGAKSVPPLVSSPKMGGTLTAMPEQRGVPCVVWNHFSIHEGKPPVKERVGSIRGRQVESVHELSLLGGLVAEASQRFVNYVAHPS